MVLRISNKEPSLPPVIGLALPEIPIPPALGPEGVVEVALLSIAYTAWLSWNILKAGDLHILESQRTRREENKKFEQLMYEYERRGFSRLDAIRLAHAEVSRPTKNEPVRAVTVQASAATSESATPLESLTPEEVDRLSDEEKVAHTLRLADAGIQLYRDGCVALLRALETRNEKTVRDVVADYNKRSAHLASLFPESTDPLFERVLKNFTSSMLEPLVLIQRGFAHLLTQLEVDRDFTNMQALVMYFFLTQAGGTHVYLTQENGYQIDSARRQLAVQLLDWLDRHSDYRYFKDGRLYFRIPETIVDPEERKIQKAWFPSETTVYVQPLDSQLLWPPDSEQDAALRYYAEVGLGWKVWTRRDSASITVAVELGASLIWEGVPVNRKVAESNLPQASAMLGQMVALALFDDESVLNKIQAVAAGESDMAKAAQLVLGRIPQLRPMSEAISYADFVAKARKILTDEEAHAGSSSSDHLANFLLGPVEAIRALREEMLRKNPEWYKDATAEQAWQQVDHSLRTLKK